MDDARSDGNVVTRSMKHGTTAVPSEVGDVRAAVFARDGQCVASIIDSKAGPCYDQWGYILDPKMPLAKAWEELEMDYVRLDAVGKHHELPEDHVMVCPGHHRGTGPSAGYIWATSHRSEQRAYLDRKHGPRNG
jgi:hypothetical protein